MKIQSFADTDTVYVLVNNNLVFETRDWDENTLIDLDANGNLIAITIEHARERTAIANFVFQQIATPSPA